MKPSRRLWLALDSPRMTLWVVLAFYLIFFWARLADLGGDISRFVVAGDRFAAAATAPANLYILQSSDGYDGQFYYRLAIEPFTAAKTGHGITLDSNPAYRQQRILYPLLVHCAALGRPLLVPLAMVTVNLIAAGLLGWLSGRLAQAWGQHALAGLGLALYPGLLLSFDRDLVEIVEMVFVVATLLALVQRRPVLATATMCLALLAKETSLGLAAAAAPALAWALFRRRQDGPAWHLIAAPALLYVGWQAWLKANWGSASLAGNVVRHNISAPGAEGSPLPAFIQALFRHAPLHDLTGIELLILLAFGLAVLVALWRSRASLHLKLAFLGYLALMMVIRHYGGGDWAFLRALSEYWIIGGVILLAGARWPAALFALLTTCSWCLLAFQVIAFR